MKTEAEEMKDYVKANLEKQLSAVHTLIEAFSILNSRAVSIDQRQAGLRPWVIKQLKDEGYLVTEQFRENEGKIVEHMLFIDWH